MRSAAAAFDAMKQFLKLKDFDTFLFDIPKNLLINARPNFKNVTIFGMICDIFI